MAQKACLAFYPGTGGQLNIIVYSCHGLGGNQFLAFAKSGHVISTENLCYGINNEKRVVLVHCSQEDKSQLWDFDVKVDKFSYFKALEIITNSSIFS